jgi:hypothetical protein
MPSRPRAYVATIIEILPGVQHRARLALRLVLFKSEKRQTLAYLRLVLQG